MTRQQAQSILAQSDEIVSAAAVAAALDQIAKAIDASLGDSFPLVLSVLGGATVFTGMLLPRLPFPLEFNYLHLTRYGQGTQPDGATHWRVAPACPVSGRTVLVLDDIVNDGETMAAMRTRILELGASRFASAVLCEKTGGPGKVLRADFSALPVPNRRVFGCGMDIDGFWRNLPSIHAVA